MEYLDDGLKPGSAKAVEEPRERWHLLYYCLAGFDLLTIVASLAVSHSLLGFFGRSIDLHNEWMRRAQNYERLSESVAKLDDPGNMVFRNHDFAAESSRLRGYAADFSASLAEMRKDAASIASLAQRRQILDHLQAVEGDVNEMTGLSGQVIGQLRAGRENVAAGTLAQMDLSYGRVNAQMNELYAFVWESAKNDLKDQEVRAEGFEKWERAFAGVVLLIVFGVVAYGRAMSRRIREARHLIETQRAQMVSASRLSSLGEMAGGVAHEINNPLAIVKMRAERLKEQVERGTFEPSQVIEAMAQIEKTCNRMAKIVKGLRAFARDGHSDPMQAESVRKIVDQTLDLCRSKLEHDGVELKLALPAEDSFIECRATEISQVLLNLIANAGDAVAACPGKWVGIEVRDRESAVEICVTDGGDGVPADLRAKIMQPFFTTKEVGKGTGLGLSISTGIAAMHGGELYLDPAFAVTRFVFRLPKRQAPGRAAPGVAA